MISDEDVLADHENAVAVKINHAWVLLHAPGSEKPKLPSDIKQLLQVKQMLTTTGQHIEIVTMKNPLQKKMIGVYLPGWMAEALKELKRTHAVDLNQLFENFISAHFKGDLEVYRPSEEDQDVEKPSKKRRSTSKKKKVDLEKEKV